MPFHSKHAPRIWDALYRVRVPDVITQNTDYLRLRGTYVTGYEPVDEMIKTNKIDAMVPIIKIVEYYVDGVEVEITSRDDMVAIYKSIKDYLSEWEEYIKYSVNAADKDNYAQLLISLDKLAEDIHARLNSAEVGVFKLKLRNSIGVRSPLQAASVEEEDPLADKPDYKSIRDYIEAKKVKSRFD